MMAIVARQRDVHGLAPLPFDELCPARDGAGAAVGVAVRPARDAGRPHRVARPPRMVGALRARVRSTSGVNENAMSSPGSRRRSRPASRDRRLRRPARRHDPRRQGGHRAGVCDRDRMPARARRHRPPPRRRRRPLSQRRVDGGLRLSAPVGRTHRRPPSRPPSRCSRRPRATPGRSRARSRSRSGSASTRAS